ncbi:MAG: hypothetical protein ACI4EX_06675, partial [Lachnospiraceae bacterium]
CPKFVTNWPRALPAKQQFTGMASQHAKGVPPERYAFGRIEDFGKLHLRDGSLCSKVYVWGLFMCC